MYSYISCTNIMCYYDALLLLNENYELNMIITTYLRHVHTYVVTSHINDLELVYCPYL